MNIFKNYIRLWMLLIASIMSCVAIAQDENYGIGDGFDPANPGNPGSNGWNAATGEVIIDDFTTGNLNNSITKIIGNSGSAAVTQIVVAGVINNTDFRVGNNYAKCTLVDFSRTAGISTVPSSAYRGDTILCNIMLPTSITEIGSDAFSGCSSLSVMTCYTITPPKVGSNAFNRVNSGMIVYVPSGAVGNYQEADVWKDFTILPIQETVHSLTVKLPTDIDLGAFKNMTLELVNAKSGQSYRYIITDKVSYVFNNLIENTVYKAYVKNNLNNIFGETSEVSINDKDTEVTFASLTIPQNVNLSIIAGGNDITSQATVTWTDSIGNYLSQGSSLTGYAIGKKLNYSIALPQNIVMEFALPNTTQYVVADGGNNIVCTLSPLQKVVVTGKVLDLTTKSAISGAVVSASQTFGGKYSKTTNVKTDAKGQYSIEIFRVPTSLAIAASDYISQTMECDIMNAEDENISVADVSLKSISGAVISIDFTYKKCPNNAGEEGEVESFYSDYNNVDYTIFNKTQNRSIGQFNVQYPQIVLLEEVNENDILEITASSRTSAFTPVVSSAIIDSEQRAYATFDIVEMGKLKSSFATNANASVVGSLYDANGKLIKTYDYSGGSLTVSNLADGNYTLVTMGGSRLFNTIYDLNQLPQTGLTKDVDYVQNSVSIKSGKLSVISIAEVPTLDESKLYYTGDNTSFTVNKSSIVAGNYLTLTSHLDFKSAYSTKVSNVNLIVDLPESCSFVENSVMVGNS
ncbi:MAG: leucine-rich repeat protein, partial [Prevotella sp.]